MLRRVSFSSVFESSAEPSAMLRSAQRQRAELLRKRQRFRLARQKLKCCSLADDDLLAVFLFDVLIDRENAHIAKNGFAAVRRLFRHRGCRAES